MGISKALVVDDSRLARVALTKMLTRRGLEVATAGSGTEAITVLRESSPDVVFIDYMMPDMDGFQAAAEINRIRGDRRLPLVMYTSQDSDEDRARAREIGICGFLSKPTSDQGLDAVLRDVEQWRPPAATEVVEDTADVDEELALLQEAYARARPDDSPPPARQPVAVGGERRESSQRGQGAFTASPPPPPAASSTIDETLVRALAADAARDAVEALTGRFARDAESVADERVRAAVRDLEARLQSDRLQHERQWQDGLKTHIEAQRRAAEDAAVRAARELTDQRVAEVERNLGSVIDTALEQWRSASESPDDALRRELTDIARAAAREVAAPEARRQAGVTASELAREVAATAGREAAALEMANALEAVRLERASADQDIQVMAQREVDAALARVVAQDHSFGEQVLRVVSEHAAPLLKNQLDIWVEERARRAVEDAVVEQLEQTVDVMVQRAVIASAEAAVREADALHARTRRQLHLVSAALAVGVVVAVAIAIV